MAAETRASQIVAEARMGKWSLLVVTCIIDKTKDENQ
jgi:hypothetical protein